MRRHLASIVVAVAAVGALAAPARAAQYPGWGDTGWVWASRRDCCLAAISIAADYSMEACITAGGRPRPTSGQQRGSCRTERAPDPETGVMLYRCYGEAAVWCR
jgi:hypothetical protein